MKTVWAKTLESLWGDDKEHLRKMRPMPNINYASKAPDLARVRDELDKVYAAAQGRHEVKVESPWFEKRRKFIWRAVSAFYMQEFEPPTLEVYPLEGYVRRCRELASDFDRKVSQENMTRLSAGSAHYFTHARTAVLSDNSYWACKETRNGIVPVPLEHVLNDENRLRVQSLPWSKSLVDLTLADVYSGDHFWMARGESGDAHVALWKEKDAAHLVLIYQMSLMMRYVSLSRAILEKMPASAPEVLLGKIADVWTAPRLYQGLDALVDAEGTLATVRQMPVFRPTGEFRDGKEKLEVREYTGDSK